MLVAEINPHVIALRDEFGIPPDSARLRVVCQDGAVLVRDPPQRFDVLLVDGFDWEGLPDALCSQAFYDDCAQALTDTGVIGDVRGRGAMLAIEIVKPGTNEPDPVLTKAIAAEAFKRGVILLTCGSYGNIIRLLPPLVISDELLDEGIAVLSDIVREMAAAR